MERVEHTTTIGNIFMNEDGIEHFKAFMFWLGEFSIGRNVTSENHIENFASV